MNERIRELWDKAAIASAAYPSGQNNSWETQVNFMEKFAELIVGECCDVLQNEDIRHSGYGYNQGFLHKKIKEHFGVEE